VGRRHHRGRGSLRRDARPAEAGQARPDVVRGVYAPHHLPPIVLPGPLDAVSHGAAAGPGQEEVLISSKKDKSAGVPDMFLWGNLVGNGVINQKDASLLAGFHLSGPDSISTPDYERDAMSERANRALLDLGAGWSMWFNVDRRRVQGYIPADQCHFPDRISRMIDEERREQFENGSLFKSRHSLLFSFRPSSDMTRRVGDMMYGNNDEEITRSDRVLLDLKKKISNVESALSSVCKIRRMRSYQKNGNNFCELVNNLDMQLTGYERELMLPEDGSYLDGVIGNVALDPSDPPKIDGHYVGVVSIDGFPLASYAGILDELDMLPYAYRWSTRFVFMDKHESRKALKALENKWNQRVRGLTAQIFQKEGKKDRDAEKMVEQVVKAQEENNSDITPYGFLSSKIVIRAETQAKLDATSKEINNAIFNANFAGRIEDLNTIDAFLGSLAGHSIPDVRRPPHNTRHLVDYSPLCDIWTGSPNNENPLYPPDSPAMAMMVTKGRTPFYFNIDWRHTVIFGPTGAGKTFLMDFLALSNLRYEDIILSGFDYKKGMLVTTKAIGGNYYDIGEEGGPKWAPFSVLETDDDLAWAEGWVATCFYLAFGFEPSPDNTKETHLALSLLRASPLRTISDFVAQVNDAQVKKAMEHYTILGPAGKLLDSKQDSVDTSRSFMNIFETEEFMVYPEKTRLPVMLYLFRVFERSLTGRPAILFLNECWSYLTNKVFLSKLAEWLRVLRSKNCVVIMETQNVSEIANSNVASLIKDSCQNMIFLPNAKANQSGTKENPGSKEYYEMLGLDATDIGIIRSATPKRDIYIVEPRGKRLCMIEPGPRLLALAGSSSKEEIAMAKKLMIRHGDRWVDELFERSIDDNRS